MFGKQAKSNTELGVWVLIGLVVVLLFKQGVFSTVGTPGTPEAPLVVQTGCDVASTTVTVGKAVDKFAPSTVVTAAYHDVLVNGAYRGTYAEGATVTLAPKDKVKVYYNLNDTSPTYYAGEGKEFEIPCTGALATSDYDSDAQLVANSTMTITINNDDGTVNSATTTSGNQTINTGESRTVKLTLQGAYQKGYSPNAPVMLVVPLNTTMYKDAAISGKTKVSAPAKYKVPNVDSSAFAFLLDPIMSNDRKEYSLTLVAQTNVNPTSAITIAFIDADYFRDSVTGEYKLGYETNIFGEVGPGDQTATLAIV